MNAIMDNFTAAKNLIAGIYDVAGNLVTNGGTNASVVGTGGASQNIVLTFSSDPTPSLGIYILWGNGSSGSGTMSANYDTSGTSISCKSSQSSRAYDGTTPVTTSPPTCIGGTDRDYSIYATYTADAPPAATPPDDGIVIFE